MSQMTKEQGLYNRIDRLERAVDSMRQDLRDKTIKIDAILSALKKVKLRGEPLLKL